MMVILTAVACGPQEADDPVDPPSGTPRAEAMGGCATVETIERDGSPYATTTTPETPEG